MAYQLTKAEVDDLFERLGAKYRIFAPKRFPKQGRYSGTDLIRYAEVHRFDDIVWDTKSDFPTKEVINPVQETLFYFTEDEYRESKAPTKPALVFGRACDINAQLVQADIFRMNGGYTDSYYTRMRELVHFVLMDCEGGDDTCFCVSMGTNKTDDYAIAVKFSEDGLKATVKDETFAPYFANCTETEFEPTFVEENELKVTIPDLSDPEIVLALKKHPMWQEYNKRCISCGACTVACSTCTCFVTRDVIWGDNPEVGERRRVYHSCQVPGFDTMAGQREMRPDAAGRMRYKVLHKIRDHKARFGTRQMCVGCGRCIHRCPEFISIAATIEKVGKAVEEIKQQRAEEVQA